MITEEQINNKVKEWSEAMGEVNIVVIQAYRMGIIKGYEMALDFAGNVISRSMPKPEDYKPVDIKPENELPN